MAAVFAIVASLIAYKGALAKVEFDREISDRDLLRRKLGLFLRLEAALEELNANASQVKDKLQTSYLHIKDRNLITEEFLLDEPAAISEAWDNLDFFPAVMIVELRVVRKSTKLLSEQGKKLGHNREWKYSSIAPTELSEVSKQIDALIKAVRNLQVSLQAEIKKITHL